jgi:DNA-binding response OmpR family regulator
MKQIMIVENPVAPEAGFCRLLGRVGYHVTRETDDNSVLYHLALRENIDVLILDDYAGKIDGCDFLRAAKRVARDVPIIIMTSKGSVTEYLQSRALGAYEYINKPVDDDEVLRIVHAALSVLQNSGPSKAVA